MRRLALACFLGLLVACDGRATSEPTHDAPEAGTKPPPTAPIVEAAKPPPPIARPQIDGHDFPDGLVALTWDDGPDAHTIELASYLARAKVRATFFVVGAWKQGVSSDPGEGDGVFTSGTEAMPIVAKLVALGHRVGNHTLHHALLTSIDPSAALEEIRGEQRAIDPFLTNELRVFRAPGGAWNEAVASALVKDEELARVRGPLRWDIDRKDWERSLGCDSDAPSIECDRGGPKGSARTKPSVVAARYLGAIEEAKHGVVLFHDRVGHVGSTYALDLAKRIVPELVKRGFVFVAPLLSFGAMETRGSTSGGAAMFGDVDGDGRADLCALHAGEVECAISEEVSRGPDDRMPKQAFAGARIRVAAPIAPSEVTIAMGDVNGDRRADLCAFSELGVACAMSTGAGFSPFAAWSRVFEYEIARETIRFGDVDGDGDDDVCARSNEGRVFCAMRRGAAFEAAKPWARARGAFELADVDGDGRADMCELGGDGVTCAVATPRGFGERKIWSPDLAGELRFGDVNGDGRSDVCASKDGEVRCAFSNGNSFTKPTIWMRGALDHFALADVNGDGRADLSAQIGDEIRCALAP